MCNKRARFPRGSAAPVSPPRHKRSRSRRNLSRSKRKGANGSSPTLRPVRADRRAGPSSLPETTSGRRIELTGVEFAYADGATVLPRMNLTVDAGQTVALVGATGAGKSTLVKLITRFYDPKAGFVSVDGVDIRDISDAELRRNIVMVTQESYLFSGSIADNIRVGKPDATDAEVEDAARAVGLHDYVAGLPDGYKTDVKNVAVG